MALAVVAEAIGVARAAGIPADLEHTQAMVLRSLKTHAGHQPSMLQDILAHRRTEIDSINGAIVRAARERNIPVPYTEMLWTLVSIIDARQAAHLEPGPHHECHPERSAAAAIASGV
jgi:2-dehydropantoate 2-reductase